MILIFFFNVCVVSIGPVLAVVVFNYIQTIVEWRPNWYVDPRGIRCATIKNVGSLHRSWCFFSLEEIVRVGG